MSKDMLISVLVVLFCILVIILFAWQIAHYNVITVCLEKYPPSKCKEFF
jgi:phage shock protein PspC (stress-responsive transcriptional regulator)